MTQNNTVDWRKFQSEYVKWTRPGQVVEGTVLNVGVGSFQGNDYPELRIRTTDSVVTVSASQAQLMRLLAEKEPATGDYVWIKYRGEGESTQAGMNRPKLFTVDVDHGDIENHDDKLTDDDDHGDGDEDEAF